MSGWTQARLNRLVEEKGPFCPDFACGHVYCEMIRQIRLQVEVADSRPRST